MAGATILVDGMSKSLTEFARQNLDGRFLVSGTPNYYGPVDFNPSDATLIAEVQKYHAAYLAERKAAAKRYGIEYDERSEIQPVTEDTNPNVPAGSASRSTSSRWPGSATARTTRAAPPRRTPGLPRPRRPTPWATTVYEPKNLGHLSLTPPPGRHRGPDDHVDR